MRTAAGADDPRAAWPRARLIPTAGIKGVDEQERRATSSLLAVMGAVPDFGHALLKELGAPKSPRIETFTEVRFRSPSGGTLIPDGVIVCERGQKSWTCLVEVKTSGASLRPEQVASYLDVARDNGFDAVLTVSNDITASSTESPVAVDGRKTRKVALRHFSWWRITTDAVVQARYRGVSDPDQEWILRELIAYLEHPASGAGGFSDMGDGWVTVRKGVHERTARAGDSAVRDVVERWEQFVEFMCLGFSQELGHTVKRITPRGSTAEQRCLSASRRLADEGLLEATIRIPDAVGDVSIKADLRSKQTTMSVTLDAPREMRAKPRLNWLLRQLVDSPDSLRVEVHYPNARSSVSETLGVARDDIERLLYPQDRKREPKGFTLTTARPMGQKRGKAAGSFVSETLGHALGFYGELVQNLKTWTPRAPKLHDSVDGTEVSDGVVESPQAIPVSQANALRDPPASAATMSVEAGAFSEGGEELAKRPAAADPGAQQQGPASDRPWLD